MAGGRRNLGFPTNQIKGSDWTYYPGCGGLGATLCFEPASYSYIYWSIKVNPFSVHNSELVLHNDGFAPHTDSPVGVCLHNDGAQRGFDILLLHESPVGGLDRSLATGIITVPDDITFPYELEFEAEHIPQPDHPDYERRIWVALDLGTTGLMTGLPQNSEVMQTVKLNWEGRP